MRTKDTEVAFEPPLKYNAKLHRLWFMRKLKSLSLRIMDWYDSRLDKKICGCSLVEYIPSQFRETKGATGSHASRYLLLDKVLRDVEFSPEDKAMDVGCGKARVFAYLLKRGFAGEMHGIELNPEVADLAKAWTKRYENITITAGDAFALDYNAYTVLFLGRPFELPILIRFIKKLEEELTHPITVCTWYDQATKNNMDHRPGWTLKKRGWVFRSHGFYLERNPQRYSIWVFDPNEKEIPNTDR